MSEEIEIRAGRRSAAWTGVKDWVVLACTHADEATACTCAQGAKVYHLLCMHLNRKRGDQKVWPTTDALARMMGRARGDKIAPWLAWLVALKAIEVRRLGTGGRYVYTVHEEPPAGYAGPTSLGEWYHTNRDELDRRRAAAKAKRDERRSAQRATKDEVNGVTPEPGEHHQADAVTPDPGEHVHPVPGEHVTPDPGRELPVLELPEDEPPPSPPAGTVPGPRRSAGARVGESIRGEPHPAAVTATRRRAAAREPTAVDIVAAELRQLRPRWSLADIVRALTTEVDAGLSLPLVAAAARLCYADRSTRHPNRLPEDGPWWDEAAEQICPPPGAASRPVWCGHPDCDRETRFRVVEVDGMPRGAHCPQCHPRLAAIAP